MNAAESFSSDSAETEYRKLFGIEDSTLDHLGLETFLEKDCSNYISKGLHVSKMFFILLFMNSNYNISLLFPW